MDTSQSIRKGIDLVWGAEAVAAELGVSKRRAFHLLERGAIPAKKVGGRWVTERGKLHEFFIDPTTD